MPVVTRTLIPLPQLSAVALLAAFPFHLLAFFLSPGDVFVRGWTAL